MTGLKNPVIDSLTVSAYHIADGEVRPVTVSAYTADNGVLTGLSFVTDGFSPYIVSYTVEFHNGGSTVVIDGGSEILLSTLISELGFTRNDGETLFTVDEVASVGFRNPLTRIRPIRS